MMGEIMQFPETVEEFMQQYKITDTQQVYTNGTELVPIFRMEQWFEAHKQRWIPCSERLPEIGTTVLTLDKRHNIRSRTIRAYMDGELYFTPDGLAPGRHITHWQPLPEPPEEGGTRNAVD